MAFRLPIAGLRQGLRFTVDPAAVGMPPNAPWDGESMLLQSGAYWDCPGMQGLFPTTIERQQTPIFGSNMSVDIPANFCTSPAVDSTVGSPPWDGVPMLLSDYVAANGAPDYLSMWVSTQLDAWGWFNQCAGPFQPAVPVQTFQIPPYGNGFMAVGSDPPHDGNPDAQAIGYVSRDTAAYSGDPGNDAQRILFPYSEFETLHWNIPVQTWGRLYAHEGCEFIVTTYYIDTTPPPPPAGWMCLV